MSKGILVYAFNNEAIHYVKQARDLAIRAEKYLGLPTTIITDTPINENVFDNVIVETLDAYTAKQYNNGTTNNSMLSFKNTKRSSSFELSPYDETLILDSDVIICDDTFRHCFDQSEDLLMYRDAYHIAQNRDYREFDKISDTSIDFYWATCVFFRKTKPNKTFFDLVEHVKDNYPHYRMSYQILSQTFRNDFAFSIAAHIMNDHSRADFVAPMPGTLFYTSDRDIVCGIKDDTLEFVCEDGAPYKTQGMTIHAMNKFSLEELL